MTERVRLYEHKIVQNLIQNLILQHSHIDIWQKISKHEKVRYPAIGIKVQSNEIFFAAKKPTSKLNMEKSLYCHIPQEKIVFKSKIKFLSLYKFSISMPDYIAVPEKRRLPRISVESKNIIAAYHFGNRHSKTNRYFHQRFKIMDYNPRGLGVIVTAKMISKFYKGDIITAKLPTQNMAIRELKVVHVSPIQNDKFKVGLCFI